MQRLDLGTNNVSTLEQGNYWLICEEYYYMLTFIAPRCKKPKLLKEPKKTLKQKGKKSKAERAMEKATEAFLKYQQEAEARFLKWEEEQWQKEREMEDRQRKEDKEHETRMLQMLGQFLQPRFQYSESSQSFNPYNLYDSYES